MRMILSVLLVLMFCSLSSAQGFDLGKYDTRNYGPHKQDRPLGDLRANPYSPNSLKNPYGAGSPYKADGLMNPYSRSGSAYSNESWRNPYASSPPKIDNGGEFSTNRYRSDSTSNPYGQYGNQYSPDSLSNPYGAGNPYLNRPLYVFPSKR